MQQLMGTHAARHAEVFLVELLDGRIVVRFADKLFAVTLVERAGAFFLKIYPVAYIRNLQRLSAAVDTAARAGHDFALLPAHAP